MKRTKTLELASVWLCSDASHECLRNRLVSEVNMMRACSTHRGFIWRGTLRGFTRQFRPGNETTRNGKRVSIIESWDS
jgi:hypothetical protein